MKKVWDLYKKYEEIINYLIVGVLTTIVSLAVYYLLVYIILDPNKAIQLQIANIVSWVAGVVFAFGTNRKYVFKSKNKNIIKEATSFVGSRVATLLMDMGIMCISVTLFKMNDKIAKIISQVVVIVANYVLSKLFVFKQKSK